MAQFYCMTCDGLNEFTHPSGTPRLYPLAEDVCAYCGASGKWRTGGDPKKAYDLSVNDKRFLRSLRIDPE
jgi:hypothetical protein